MFEVGEKIKCIKYYYDLNTKHIMKEGEICKVVRFNSKIVVLRVGTNFFGLHLDPNSQRYIWNFFDKTEYITRDRKQKINKIKERICLNPVIK